jgi:hypothetical protein
MIWRAAQVALHFFCPVFQAFSQRYSGSHLTAIHSCGVGQKARLWTGETPVPQEKIKCIGLNREALYLRKYSQKTQKGVLPLISKMLYYVK